jgi:1-acyl-sn-glycerol-3-phosphate acyltransferase
MSPEKELQFCPVTVAPDAHGCSWRPFFQHIIWFPLAYVIFAVVGGLTSAVCFVLSLAIPADWGRPLGQILIHRLFAFFVWYLERTGLASFDFQDLASLHGCRGTIIAVNHPTLLDAVFVVSRLPRVCCLMKAGILTNLVLCGTARLAGYVDNRSGMRLVKQCADLLRHGESLVVFPEGTRTIGPGINSF